RLRLGVAGKRARILRAPGVALEESVRCREVPCNPTIKEDVMDLRHGCSHAGRGGQRFRAAYPSLVLALVALVLGAAPAFADDFTVNAVVVDIDGKVQAGVKVVLGRIDIKDTE